MRFCMKSRLAKILFTSLFLSAAISSGIQACFLANSLGALPKALTVAAKAAAEKVRLEEIARIAALKAAQAAQEGRGAIPIEVVAIAVVVPVVLATVAVAAKTGNIAGAVAAGEEVMTVLREKMEVAGKVMLAGAIVVGAGKVIARLRN